MKIVHINESVLNRLLEDKRKPPFEDFYKDVMSFINGIFKDPIGTVPSEMLKSNGLHNGELRKKLYDYGIITKKERIDEPYDETTGNKQSRYYVKYDWTEDSKKQIKKNDEIGKPLRGKILKLYNNFFNISEAYHTSKGLMLHNMGVVSDKRAPEYVRQATDIYNNKINNRNNTLNFVRQGDILYPMGKAKDIIGKNKVTWDEFDFGLSQKLVKNGYKIAVKGDI